ncbi:AraC family transcriptional regulator [Duganella sp. LX20W]|uniref:AraC family transcriptional regulator n=1 Tax=Rugamonas brunnea TaxID=2758569 RepID=A0A7W2IAM7_9BURK|nr:helix-turn-helix domain-containing protein [Rugamonas brunnea]MBA5636270.1 AraC family transcriptional regulator [Rugamonas brunnea]
MRRFHLLPIPPLQPYIDRLWGWESAPGETIALPTLLPGAGAELYFHYRRPFRHAGAAGDDGAALCSAPHAPAHLLSLRTVPLALATMAEVGFIAVRFRSGMLACFTPVPAAELHDRPRDVADVWGAPGRQCAAGVARADTHAERLTLIQQFLLRQLRPERADPLVEAAVDILYRSHGGVRIEPLADRLHLGRRQLERRVLAWTGQTPAALRRLCRFHHTVRALLLAPGAPGLDTALRHGYFDQAHFIHDFRALAHTTPQRFLRQASGTTHFYNPPRAGDGTIQAP